MRTIRNLTVAIIAVASIMTQGCNESQQASTGPTTSAKAEKTLAMNYDIKDRDAFTVMGITASVKSTERNAETYNKIWETFEPYRAQIRPISVNWGLYGIDFPGKDKNIFEYVAGMSVHSDTTPLDPNLVIRNVPAATYAVFKCASQDMGKTNQYIYSEWLPASRYKIDKNACCFEQYAPREWMNRPVYIYIPIVPK